MKITKTMRFLLVALAAAMVFSLFACTDPVEGETTAPQGNETTEATGNETTAPKGDETTEPQGGATTVPAGDDTTEPAGEDTTAPKGEDTTTAPKGDDETEPKGEDTTTAPKGDDETEPKGEDTTTAPKGDDETEPPHEHTWVDATCKAPKTCACGATEGDPIAHTWVDATCKAPKTCSACGDTEGEALAHTWVDATCKAPKTCSACGDTEGVALAHTWVDATCTAPKTCSACGDTEGEALPHTDVYTEVDATNHSITCADCSEPAKTEAHTMVLGEDPCYKVCSKCGYKSETHEAITVDWTPVEGTVDGKLYEQKVCSVCSAPVEKREAAFYLSPDNMRVDGTTTKHIVNNSGKNQTTGLGFSAKKSAPLVVNATDVFADGKYVTTTVGLGGWVAINGGAKTYVYRVNGGEWQEATCHISSLDDSKTAHIKLVEESNLGIKDYYSNAMLDSGIFTKDLQAEFGGQVITVEFGAVPNNNPGTDEAPNAIVIARYENIKVFKTTAIDTLDGATLGAEAGATNGNIYKWTADKTGLLNLECPVINGVNYTVSIKNSTKDTVSSEMTNRFVSIQVAKGDTILVTVAAEEVDGTYPAFSGTFKASCYTGAYGANFTPAGSLGYLSLGRDDDGNAVLTALGMPEGKTIDRYFCFINDTKTAGRYVAVTYKSTDAPKLSCVHMQGYAEDGSEIGWKASPTYYLQKDGEVHTVIFDIYEVLPYGSTLRSFRFDVLEDNIREGGASITILGFEVHDDASVLARKFNTSTWEAKGSSLVAIESLGTDVKAGSVAGTGNCFTSTNQVITEKDVYINVLNKFTVPGRYIVIRAKAHTASSYIATVYVSGINKDTSTGFTNATGIGGPSLKNHVGEWVTIILDTDTVFNGNYDLESIRIDHCEWSQTVGDRTMSFERVAVYTDLDLAIASAGNDPIYMCALTNGTEIPVNVTAGDTDGVTYYVNAGVGAIDFACPTIDGVSYTLTVNNTNTGVSASSADAINGVVSITSDSGNILAVTIIAEPVEGEYPAINAAIGISKRYALYGSAYTTPGTSVPSCEVTRDGEGNIVITKTGSGTPYFEVVNGQKFEDRYLAITYKTVGCTGATGGFSKYYKADGTYVGWTGKIDGTTVELTRYGTHISMTANTEGWQTVIIDTYDLMLYRGKLEEGATLYSLRLDFSSMQAGQSLTIKGVEFGNDYEALAEKFENVTYIGVN